MFDLALWLYPSLETGFLDPKSLHGEPRFSRIWRRISNDPFGRCYGLCDEFVVYNRRNFLEILTKKKRIYDILRVDFYSMIDL